MVSKKGFGVSIHDVNALAMIARKKAAEEKPRTQEEIEGTLRERAMLVRFSVGRWYGTGADDEVTAKVKRDAEAVGDVGVFTKRFMSRDALAQINAVTNEARKYHKRVTLPWFEKVRILSVDIFFDYKKEMTAYQMRFEQAVEKFLLEYEELKGKEKQRLGKLYRESDYPSAAVLRKRFRYDLAIEPLPNADDFRVDVGREELERLRSEIEERVSESVHEATTDLWHRMYESVEHLREQLAKSEGAIRSSLFENIKEMVALLPKLNITRDPKLQAMSERVAKELLEVDVDAVRESAAVRSDVAKKADKILASMKSFVGDQQS